MSGKKRTSHGEEESVRSRREGRGADGYAVSALHNTATPTTKSFTKRLYINVQIACFWINSYLRMIIDDIGTQQGNTLPKKSADQTEYRRKGGYLAVFCLNGTYFGRVLVFPKSNRFPGDPFL